MLVLVIASLLLFAVCAWFLAKPFKQSSNAEEIAAQVRQYSLARDRVLRQLEQLESQADEGILEASVAADETLRRETELATILNHLDTLEATSEPASLSQHGRLQWYLAMAVFALVIPLVAVIFYGSWQADTLLKLAGVGNDGMSSMTQSAQPAPPGPIAAQAFPPEVLEMVARLEKRMADSPNDGAGWKRLGRSYTVMGRRDDALNAYRKAAALLPDDSEIAASLADLQANSASSPAQAGQSFPPQVLAMVAQLEKRLGESPQDGDGWKRLGRAYMVMQRYSEAVSAYTSAAEILPNDQSIQQALQQLAQIASKGGRHKNTDVMDNNAQAAHPPLPKGSLENIIKLEKAIAKEPENAIAWTELAKAYTAINRKPDAIRAFAKAYELRPNSVLILSMYAEAVFNNNPRDPDGKALALYTTLNALSPRHPDGLWFLGLAAYSEGNLGRTVELWSQLLAVLPPNGEGYASVRQALSRVEILLNKDK